MKYSIMAATILLAATCGLVNAADTATSDHTVKVETLVHSDKAWNGTPYERYGAGHPELTVLRMHIPAHTTLPWHTHPMPNAAYIISGHLTIEDKVTGQKKRYNAGEALPESVDTVHRGMTDSEDVIVVVTYAGTPGTPLSVPVAGGKPEY